MKNNNCDLTVTKTLQTDINHNASHILYQHFNQPDYSIVSITIRIIEKIYHRTNNPHLAMPLCRQKEVYLIRQSGTTTPYGCNDKIFSTLLLNIDTVIAMFIVIIHHLLCMMSLLMTCCQYAKTITSHSQEILFITPFKTVQFMFRNYCYRLLFKPTQTYSYHFRILQVTDFSGKDEKEKRSFRKLSFANKGIDGVNLGNILHNKLAQSIIPSYFKDQSVPIISYTYTKPIATKIFNFKLVLKDLYIDDLLIAPVLVRKSHIIQLAM